LRAGIAATIAVVIATGAIMISPAAQNRLEEGRETFRQKSVVFIENIGFFQTAKVLVYVCIYGNGRISVDSTWSGTDDRR
jgi:hypothetical protein